MNVLVTGGLGYLGGRLVEHLRRKDGYKIRLLVRRQPHELSTWFQGLEVWPADLTRPETLLGVGEGIDAVVHLAALNQSQCAQHPDAALAVNVGGTMHLMEALGPDLGAVVYLSTFHIYGANGHDVVTESTATAPVHAYAATHAMAELCVAMYARQRGHSATILRVSNGFGAPVYPGVSSWTLIVNDLCRQAVEHGRIVLRSSGLQMRDFVGLFDVVRAIELVLSGAGTDVRTFNVGGASSSILQVARTVQSVYAALYDRELPLERPEPCPGETGRQLDFRYEPLRAAGYAPSVSLQEGVRETLEFCIDHFAEPGNHRGKPARSP